MENSETQKKQSNLTGEELLKKYLNGDDPAFERLIELYEDDLARFIYIMVGNRYEVKNLTIETFGELAITGKRFSGKSSLKTYLFGIAKNVISRHIKAQKKNDYIAFDDVENIIHDIQETPHALLEREEEKQMLYKAMKKLKKEHREVLELIYFENMSYRQAATIIGKSENSTKQLIYRAKLSLQKAMDISPKFTIRFIFF